VVVLAQGAVDADLADGEPAAVSATGAEDSADRESGSAQAVEAATEAPAEGADDTK